MKGRLFRKIPEDYGYVKCTFYEEDRDCMNPARWVDEKTRRPVCEPCYEDHIGLRAKTMRDVVAEAVAAQRGGPAAHDHGHSEPEHEQQHSFFESFLKGGRTTDAEAEDVDLLDELLEDEAQLAAEEAENDVQLVLDLTGTSQNEYVQDENYPAIYRKKDQGAVDEETLREVRR